MSKVHQRPLLKKMLDFNESKSEEHKEKFWFHCVLVGWFVLKMGNVQQNGHQSSETKHEKLVDENTSRQEQNENQNEENGNDLIDEKLNMNEGTWEMRKCCVVKILLVTCVFAALCCPKILLLPFFHHF